MMFLCSRATLVAHFLASLFRLCSSVVPVSDSSWRLWSTNTCAHAWVKVKSSTVFQWKQTQLLTKRKKKVWRKDCHHVHTTDWTHDARDYRCPTVKTSGGRVRGCENSQEQEVRLSRCAIQLYHQMFVFFCLILNKMTSGPQHRYKKKNNIQRAHRVRPRVCKVDKKSVLSVVRCRPVNNCKLLWTLIRIN